MLWKLLCIALLCAGWSATARAQIGNCPAGAIPNGDQRSPGACVPDPSYNPQSQQPLTPPPAWSNRWGAVAYSSNGTPAFGESRNMQSERSARQKALSTCEAYGAKCVISGTYRNQCIAIVAGEKTWKPETGPTIEVATQKSMDKCRANGNSECHTYYTACSYPVRIQ